MCNNCEGLCETIKIEHTYQYYNMVDQIKAMIKEGVLELEEGNCDFTQVNRSKPFSNDVLYHVFKCTSCGCRFSLCTEAYDGSGGSWEVLNVSTNKSDIVDIKVFEEYWMKFFNICKREYDGFPDTLKCSLDDIDLPYDVKVVMLVQMGEHAKRWLQSQIPVLKYKKPVEIVKIDGGILELKSVLISMPR